MQMEGVPTSQVKPVVRTKHVFLIDIYMELLMNRNTATPAARGSFDDEVGTGLTPCASSGREDQPTVCRNGW